MNGLQYRLFLGLGFFLILQLIIILTNIHLVPHKMNFHPLDQLKLRSYLDSTYNFTKIVKTNEESSNTKVQRSNIKEENLYTKKSHNTNEISSNTKEEHSKTKEGEISNTNENEEFVLNIETTKEPVAMKPITSTKGSSNTNEGNFNTNEGSSNITEKVRPVINDKTEEIVINTKESRTFTAPNEEITDDPGIEQNTTRPFVPIPIENITKWTEPTKNNTKKLLTIFTTFSDAPQRMHVQNNTLCNYLNFPENQVNLAIFSINANLSRYQLEGVTKCLSQFSYNEIINRWQVIQLKQESVLYDRPILKDMYQEAMQRYNSDFYMYTNGDILYPWNNLKNSLEAILQYVQLNNLRRYIIFGLRKEVGCYNFNFTFPLTVINLHDLETGSDEEVLGLAEGVNVTRKRAMDYFITSRGSFPWEWIPKFIIGVEKYDNWLIVYANKVKITTFDITMTTPVVHEAGAPKPINDVMYNDANDYNHKLFDLSVRSPSYHICVHNCCRVRTEFGKYGIIIKNNTKFFENNCTYHKVIKIPVISKTE